MKCCLTYEMLEDVETVVVTNTMKVESTCFVVFKASKEFLIVELGCNFNLLVATDVCNKNDPVLVCTF